MNLTSINKTVRFEAAHRLMNHPGLCSNLHGHSYKIEVSVCIGTRDIDKNTGMVMDFSDLKKIIKENIIGHFDHATVLCFNDPLEPIIRKTIPGIRIVSLDREPTAENMGNMMIDELIPVIRASIFCEVKWISIKIWETEDSYAVCFKDFQ